ncbi:hypothetical protein [Clostridium saccharobutylicum]|uniref:Uncharacterized protein n=1 Tax=Clostridium saccharobutylicum DSM 13864 TaxID=1345695 RepID=U5MN30_CLOSA|nr:hypothetical protein [Clostridium saccharobutylicum]AGX41980.1 hypothetical protein CLSA_c09690 [Clostridium saccharobutylicum DSM 13864]AQR89260.1 hypothetical protein CLOSC_09570 [Clostridium saccharobutylicum]AQR99161.1 hypothetical protein CSACC_09640 [Clostridium saccharobutylicum]AQS08893.1 hypothetical protein CLOBY_10080 [Clostridium saccharobutylicum]AQS13149.1 hypothetical protein CLOSACC_09640 [Clostridium saccharobutylicum]
MNMLNLNENELWDIHRGFSIKDIEDTYKEIKNIYKDLRDAYNSAKDFAKGFYDGITSVGFH